MGQSPSGQSYNENKEGLVFFQGRTDFGFRYPTIRLYTREPKRIAEKGDILLSVRAPVGDINIAFDQCCIGRGLAAISSEYNDYIYYALLYNKNSFDVYNNSGTIFGSINREALEKFQVQCESIQEIVSFNEYAKTVNDSILLYTKENLKLNELKQLYLKKFFG